jgi:hypothetical protein
MRASGGIVARERSFEFPVSSFSGNSKDNTKDKGNPALMK